MLNRRAFFSATHPLVGGTVVRTRNLKAALTPPVSAIPAGFDAILQFDVGLLQGQLMENLRSEGLFLLSSTVPYDRNVVPESLRAAVEEHLSPLMGYSNYAAFTEVLVELRLVFARLRTLQSELPMRPTLVTGTNVLASLDEGSASSSPTSSTAQRGVAELGWTMDLNLLIRTRIPEAVLASESAPPSTVTAPHEAVAAGEYTTPSTETSPEEGFVEERVNLARGQALIPAHVDLVKRSELLQMWYRLDFGATKPVFESDEPLMTAFLKDDLASALLSSSLAPLLTAPDLRLTPRVALTGNLSASYVALTDLTDFNVRDLMLLHPDGREVLSLCVDFDSDTPGSPQLVQPFLGTQNFAYYVSAKVFAPVLRVRWLTNPFSRIIVSDIPVELAVSQHSDETAEGLARIRIILSDDPSEVGILASDSELGDPVRFVAEQEIRLIKLWDHEGDEVTKLGTLGDPVTEPFVWHVYLFAEDPFPEETSEGKIALQEFARRLFSPVIRPTIEDLQISNLQGYTSDALQAIVLREDLRVKRSGPDGVASVSTGDQVLHR